MQASDRDLLRDYKTASAVGSALVTMVGAAAIWGWLSDVSALQSVGGGTAVAFLICGISLFLFTVAKAQALRLAASAIALAPMALGVLSLGRFIFHFSMIDEAAAILPESCLPLAHMSPNDALHMSIIAMSLFLTELKTRNRLLRALGEILIIVATLISLMSLLGLIFGMPNLCLFVSCLTISWLSAITFGVLCVSLVLANCEDGVFLSILSAPDAGGIIARRLLPAATGMPIFLGWLRVAGQNAGIYDGETGLTVMIAMLVLLTLSIILWTSWSMSRADAARRMAQTALEASEKRTRMIVQQATDAFVAVDDRGTIKDWNDAAREAFGWTRPEVLDKLLTETIAAADASSLGQLFASGETTSATKPTESQAMHKEGYFLPVELSLFPIIVDGEHIVCAFIRDITERKELQQRLADFYSTVAHELRAPLTSIRGSLAIAVDSQDMSLTRRLYDNMDASVSRLIRLINDLLDVKRIEEGRLELDLADHDSLEIVMRSTDELAGMASARDIELVPVVDRMGTVKADADRVLQVLTNLLSNAIKFSPPESVVVIKTESGSTGFLRFSVIDQGPGIPADQLHRIFTRFGQVKGSAGRAKAGTGLGLVISRAIVEQHGGQMGLDNQPEKGCRFWFELPLKDVELTSNTDKSYPATI